MISLREWLATKITDDPRALSWFDGEEAEARIVRGYKELLSGYEIDPSKILKTTRPVEGTHAGIIAVRDIGFYSMCAHHFLPFFGSVDIFYHPGDRILGLGKFPRLVSAYARRFQIQEDLVKDIAEEIVRSGGATGAVVRSRARHMCICSRGPRSENSMTETTYSCGNVELLKSNVL